MFLPLNLIWKRLNGGAMKGVTIMAASEGNQGTNTTRKRRAAGGGSAEMEIEPGCTGRAEDEQATAQGHSEGPR